MKRAIYFLMTMLALILAGCGKVEKDRDKLYIGDPVRDVRAEATAAAVRVGEANDNLDLQVREAEMDAEKAAHVVALEATRTAYTTQMSQTLIVATVEAGARAEAIRARGEAEASTIRAKADASVKTSQTMATAGAIAIPMVGIGAAVAFIILAWGHSTATVKRAVLAANYVRIGVEPRTLLPPPLIISSDGYLIDTRSGERARLRDMAEVDRLRLAAMAHNTNVALLARAEVQVAKTTNSDRPADALMSAASQVPMLDWNDTNEVKR